MAKKSLNYFTEIEIEFSSQIQTYFHSEASKLDLEEIHSTSPSKFSFWPFTCIGVEVA